MFDTSVVHVRAIAAPRGATLAISILIHSIAVVAAVALTVTSAQVPADPPRQLELYRPVELPAVPPPPPGPPPHAQHPASTPAQPQMPIQITAPAEIPDEVPQVTPATGTAISLAPATDTAGEPGGVPGGVVGGVNGGQIGGTGSGPVADHGPYTPGAGGVTQARVLTRVDPRFPEVLRTAVTSATVIVRCVIGKDGRVHDPEIVMSSFPAFNESVLDALHRWTFAPGMANGQPVDTYFELKVRFEVRR